MKQNYCDITIVLDRSGSMESVKHDTIGGFNQFFRDQKAVKGEATISLIQFDNQYEVVYEAKNIQDAPELDNQKYQPRGTTALLDAIGRTINSVGSRLEKMTEDQRPEKVIFVIQTDGYENASREFKMDKISEMIKHQTEAYQWEFVFLGANQDAIASAAGIGIGAANAMTYAANAQGTKSAYVSMSNNMAAYRTGDVSAMSFSSEDRERQKKAGAN